MVNNLTPASRQGLTAWPVSVHLHSRLRRLGLGGLLIGSLAGLALTAQAQPGGGGVSPTPNYVVNNTATVPANTYQDITITQNGRATLGGNVTVTGTLTVQTGGSLTDGCFRVLGSGSFVLQTGATLNVCDANGISLTGATGAVQTASRSFSPGGNYVYRASAAQVTGTGLPATVRTLEVNNTAFSAAARSLTLTNALSVNEVVRLTSGDLNLGTGPAPRMLTLLSTAGQGTALLDISAVGAGNVNGTLTMQRAIDSGNGAGIGYHHFASPLTGMTVAQMGSAAYTPVVNNAYNTATQARTVSPFPTLLGYDERRLTAANGLSGTAASSPATDLSTFEKGFYSPIAAGAALAVGMGYTGNVANAARVDFVGTFATGPVTLGSATPGAGLSRGAGTVGDDQGWHLLGNPYPAPLNLASIASSALTDLAAAVYVYHATGQYGGYYSTYLPDGAGTGGTGSTAPNANAASALVPAGTGFWMRVPTPGAADGALALTAANLSTTYTAQPAFGRAAADLRSQLQLQLAGPSATDNLYLTLDRRATVGVDALYDATKITNPNGLNLALLAGGTKLAIAGLPVPTAATVLPLSIGAPVAGTYALRVASMANFGATQVYLRDAVAGTELLLSAGTTVPVTLTNVATASTRFSLVLRPAGALASATNSPLHQLTISPNPAAGRFTLTVPAVAGTSSATATLVDALGRTRSVRTLALTAAGGSAEYSTSGLTAGVYALRLAAGEASVTVRVVVE